MVNHLLETSHPLSSSALRLRASARHPVFISSLHHYLLTSPFPCTSKLCIQPGAKLRLATGLVPIRYQAGKELSIAQTSKGSPVGVYGVLRRWEGIGGRLPNCSTYRRAWGSYRSLIMTLGMGMTAEIDGGCPTMSLGTRQVLQVADQARKQIDLDADHRANIALLENATRVNGGASAKRKPRVFVVAENRLLREALSRMLLKNGEIEVVGMELAEPFQTEDLLKQETDILLMSSRGNRDDDLTAVRAVRTAAPKVQILLIGVTGEEAEFLQCVRAGVRGYLLKDASAEDVVEGIRSLQDGKAICPGTLCASLFRYMEREATSFPSASVHQQLGLTRREQQLIPLIAEGLTNKEIANRFCLSEQTVKNHLYRMKHKVGAGDRLGIVQVCRTQGFMP
jgi:DNA-binding NarL/FixJ family response regulator